MAAPKRSLSDRAVQGSVVVVVGYAGREMIRLAGNLILTRLLFPDAFGLMVIVNTVIHGLNMTADLGIGTKLVQSPRGEDEEFLRTVFLMQAVRAGILWLLCLAVAPWAARIYEQPDLVAMLPVAGLTVLINGFQSTALLRRQRHLDLVGVTGLEIIALGVSAVVMVAWAWLHPTVWALVGGSIVGSLVGVGISHRLNRDRRDRFGWDRRAARELIGFGKWAFVATFLLFLAGQSDRLIFGYLVPIEVLGVYSIAWVLSSPPGILLNRLSGSIAFPALSRKREAGDQAAYAAAYARSRAPLVVIGGGISSLLFASGVWLVVVLYDPRYHEAGWMLQWLAISAWFETLGKGPRAALLSHGLSRWLALANGVKVVAIPVGIWIGMVTHGFPGAVAGYALSEVFRYAVFAMGCRSVGLPSFRIDWGPTLRVVLAGGTGLAVGVLAEGTGLSPWLGAPLAGIVAACFWLSPISRIARSHWARRPAGA